MLIFFENENDFSNFMFDIYFTVTIVIRKWTVALTFLFATYFLLSTVTKMGLLNPSHRFQYITIYCNNFTAKTLMLDYNCRDIRLHKYVQTGGIR